MVDNLQTRDGNYPAQGGSSGAPDAPHHPQHTIERRGPIERPPFNSSKPIENFIDGFGGNREQVIGEMKAFWLNPPVGVNAIDPVNLFNRLVDNRLQTGEIDPARAEYAKQQFKSSFAPEATTGYAAKHRTLLVDELSSLYVRETGLPLRLVKADIGNLGGLNNSMAEAFLDKAKAQIEEARAAADKLSGEDQKAAYKGVEKLIEQQKAEARATADKVVGVMSGIMKEEFAKLGDVVAVRSGGDELEITLKPKLTVKADEIEEAKRAVGERIKKFIGDAGLDHIVHPKYPEDPGRRGVNIGLSVVEIDGISTKTGLTEIAETGIQSSKKQQEVEKVSAYLEKGDIPPATIPDKETVTKALAHDDYAKHIPKHVEVEPAAYVADPRKTPTPDESNLGRMRAEIRAAAPESKLSLIDVKLTKATTALIDQKDRVTNMPPFTEIHEKIFPHFMEYHGKDVGAKLVHFDFSNMAGGNKIFEGVGNAMGGVYADVMREAMAKAGLEKYTPYITSQGGGKFALLVPGNTPEAITNKLVAEVDKGIDAASDKPLKLTAEERAIVRKNIATNQDVAHLYHEAGRPVPNADNLVMRDIANPKSKLAGIQVASAVGTGLIKVEAGKPVPSLYEQIKPLEETAAKNHIEITEKRTKERDNVKRTESKQSGDSREPAAGRADSTAEAERGGAETGPGRAAGEPPRPTSGREPIQLTPAQERQLGLQREQAERQRQSPTPSETMIPQPQQQQQAQAARPVEDTLVRPNDHAQHQNPLTKTGAWAAAIPSSGHSAAEVRAVKVGGSAGIVMGGMGLYESYESGNVKASTGVDAVSASAGIVQGAKEMGVKAMQSGLTGKVAEGATKLAIPLMVASAAVKAGEHLAEGNSNAAIGEGFTLGGVLAGAKAGAGAGSVFGPVGAAVGGIAGGIGGAVLIDKIGNAMKGEDATQIALGEAAKRESSGVGAITRAEALKLDQENQALINSGKAEKAAKLFDAPANSLSPDQEKMRAEVKAAEQAIANTSNIAELGKDFTPKQMAEMAYNAKLADFVRVINGETPKANEPAAPAAEPPALPKGLEGLPKDDLVAIIDAGKALANSNGVAIQQAAQREHGQGTAIS
jgi:hypothetical protein